jgi:ribosomal protein S18 acetylase RimI-like enzyme
LAENVEQLRADGVSIMHGGAERIPDLEGPWQALHEHHAAVALELALLGPVRSAGESWAIRRGLYEEWLADPHAFVMIAEAGGGVIGYALVSMRGPDETWATGDRVAQLETLVVLPGWRSRGLGRRLMNRVFDELRRIGVANLSVSVIASNAAALRFYRGFGLVPFLASFIGPVPAADVPGRGEVANDKAAPDGESDL